MPNITEDGVPNVEDPDVRVVKQSEDLVVNNSTTMVDTDLEVKLKVGKSYRLQIFAGINSPATPDAKFVFDVGGMVSDLSRWADLGDADHQYIATLTSTRTELTSGGTDIFVPLDAIIINVTTAGTLKLQFAQNTANASNSTFKKGSFMIITEIP